MPHSAMKSSEDETHQSSKSLEYVFRFPLQMISIYDIDNFLCKADSVQDEE